MQDFVQLITYLVLVLSTVRGWERLPSKWYGTYTLTLGLGFSTSRLQNRED